MLKNKNDSDFDFLDINEYDIRQVFQIRSLQQSLLIVYVDSWKLYAIMTLICDFTQIENKALSVHRIQLHLYYSNKIALILNLHRIFSNQEIKKLIFGNLIGLKFGLVYVGLIYQNAALMSSGEEEKIETNSVDEKEQLLQAQLHQYLLDCKRNFIQKNGKFIFLNKLMIIVKRKQLDIQKYLLPGGYFKKIKRVSSEVSYY